MSLTRFFGMQKCKTRPHWSTKKEWAIRGLQTGVVDIMLQVMLHNFLADAYIQAYERVAAIRELSHGIALNPECAVLWNNRAVYWEFLGYYKLAREVPLSFQ